MKQNKTQIIITTQQSTHIDAAVNTSVCSVHSVQACPQCITWIDVRANCSCASLCSFAHVTMRQLWLLLLFVCAQCMAWRWCTSSGVMEWMNDELNDRYPKYWRKWNAHVARSHIFYVRIHIRFNTVRSSRFVTFSHFLHLLSTHETRLDPVRIPFGRPGNDVATRVCVFVYCSYNCIHFVKKRKKARRENWMRMRKNYMCKNHWNRL